LEKDLEDLKKDCKQKEENMRLKIVTFLIAVSFWLSFRYEKIEAAEPKRLIITTKNVNYDLCGEGDKCGGSGHCFIHKCFCYPGASGEVCGEGTPRNCSSLENLQARLQCYFHDGYGTAWVDFNTWRETLSREETFWRRNVRESNDRADEHISGFDTFSALPFGQHLGRYAELGCGPYTQTYTSLTRSRPDLTFESITLSDPNLFNYMRNSPLSPYKDGTFLNTKTYFVAAGAEAPIFGSNSFDTVLMINVLEHVQNAFVVLENLWRMVKPGGTLIFNDRWVEKWTFEWLDDAKLHPIRIRKVVIDHFLAHFEILFRDDNGTQEMKQRGGEHGVYFIGKKKQELL
jgi:SAM-dependent methyltransferase